MGGEISGAGLWVGPDRLRRCGWCRATPGVRRLPRHRMGLSRHRRSSPLREDLPRGISGRPELADDPAQAGQLPQGLRRLRHRAGRALRRARRDAPSAGRGDRPPSRQDRGVINNAKRCARAGRRAADRSRPTSGVRARPRSRPKKSPGGAQAEPRPSPRRCRRICASGAGASSARPRCTPSCRRWGWSTTICRAAPSAHARPRGRGPDPPGRARNAGQSHRATIRPSRRRRPRRPTGLSSTMPRHHRQVSTASRRADGRASS